MWKERRRKVPDCRKDEAAGPKAGGFVGEVAEASSASERQGIFGAVSVPDSTVSKPVRSSVGRSTALSQASQSLAVDASSETQIPIFAGEPSFMMTADQSPARPPSTVDFSVLPPTAHMSPLWAAQPTWTVWVPVPICVTAVPDTFVPLATASTVVVEGCPWYLNWTAPPNAPAPLAEAAGADAAGAALPVAPAQPTTRSALTRTPRIDHAHPSYPL